MTGLRFRMLLGWLFNLAGIPGAEAAVNLGAGIQVKNASSISNGAKTVPTLFVQPVVVTQDNVKQTVIKGGFQDLDTIQKSLPKDKVVHALSESRFYT